MTGSFPETIATPPMPSTIQVVPATLIAAGRIATISVPLAALITSLPSPLIAYVASPLRAAPIALSICMTLPAAQAIMVLMIGVKVIFAPVWV